MLTASEARRMVGVAKKTYINASIPICSRSCVSRSISLDTDHSFGPSNGLNVQLRGRFLDLSSATRRVATERGAEAPSHERAASVATSSWAAVYLWSAFIILVPRGMQSYVPSRSEPRQNGR